MFDEPASYGDVTGEYLALRGAAGIVSGHHEVVWVRGPDAVPFLDGLLSRDLGRLDDPAVARSLLLQPQGKLQSLLWVLRGDGAAGLIVDAGSGEETIRSLERFLLRVEARIAADDRGVFEVWGPRSAEVLELAGIGAPAAWADREGVLAARIPLGGLPRYLLAGADRAALEAAGAMRSGRDAATAVRIEAGEPQMGVDVDESTIPQESGLVEEAVSFDKGCFLGQELVARIDSRGRVNRHLRGVVITENVLPPLGARITAEGEEMGRLTSLGESLTLRAPVGLALIRREVGPGSPVSLEWDGGSTRAVVRELPLDDFGGTA